MGKHPKTNYKKLLLVSGLGFFAVVSILIFRNSTLDYLDVLSASPAKRQGVLGSATIVLQQGQNGYSGSVDRQVGGASNAAFSSVASPSTYVLRYGAPIYAANTRYNYMLWFDLSSIPSGSTIQSATLTLKSGTVYSASTVHVKRMTDPDNLGSSFAQGWSAAGTANAIEFRNGANASFRSQTGNSTGVKWTNSDTNNESTFIDKATAEEEAGAAVQWANSETFYDHAVTEAVSSWVSGSANQGFLVYADDIANIQGNHTNQDAIAANRPKLTIIYTTPATPTPTLTPTPTPTSTPLPTAVPLATPTPTPTNNPVSNSSFEGFGANSGGINGSVVMVTNLNNSGAGSLRDAVGGGRSNVWVKFSVAGTINLQSDLTITGHHVTIDGFSAPAPGITITAPNNAFVIAGNYSGPDSTGSNIVVQGLKIRNTGGDGFQIAYNAHDVVIDHNSIYNTGDGAVDVTEGAYNVTVSWNILHKGGPGASLVSYDASRVSYHHNIFYGNSDRNPIITSTNVRNYSSGPKHTGPEADIRYNLMWDYGIGTYFISSDSVATGNVVANLYKNNGIINPSNVAVRARLGTALSTAHPNAYIAGNVCVHDCRGFAYSYNNLDAAFSFQTANSQNNQLVAFSAPSISGPAFSDQQGRLTEWTKVKNQAGVGLVFKDDAPDATVRSGIVMPAAAIFNQSWNSDAGNVVVPTPTPPPPSQNNKPTGSFDGIKAEGIIFGWAKDNDDQSKALDVHVYIDKNAGTAGASPLLVKAGDNRSDVGNHAFNFTIPSQYRDNKSHQVWVWAIDLTSSANNVQLSGSPQNFTLVIVAAPTPTPTLTPTAVPVSATLTSDLNKDGIVNSLDFSLINRKWSSTANITALDINVDGKIDMNDLVALVARWFKGG